MSLGVLVVGLGQIGMGYDLELDPDQYVHSHCRAFSQHPSFHLAAAVDPDSHRREIFTRTFQAPAHATVEAALEQHQPAVVVIATPTHLHKDTLEKILAHSNPVAVLCEKPLSYDLEEARWMVSVCAEKGIHLFVNYMRRSVPGFLEVKRRIDSGEIQTPVKGMAWYSKGFLHNGSHFVNLLEYWLGPVQRTSVIAKGRVLNQLDSEPDVWIEFEKGSVAFLAAWEEQFSHYTVELLSPSGRLRCERGGETISWQPADTGDIAGSGHSLSTTAEIIESDMARYQWHVINQISESLEGRGPAICGGEEALVTLGLMKSII
ncbi:MAG: Gfo/Idh/MocA family oxidoreductase [Pseudomonadota bacterium]